MNFCCSNRYISMAKNLIRDFSDRLKEIAKDLSFLGHPRYPLNELSKLFPQHKSFIGELEDVSVPFHVNVDEKKEAIALFNADLSTAMIPAYMKEIFASRIEDYTTLLSMMSNFGTPLFYEHCKNLYGSSVDLEKKEAFYGFLDKIPDFCVDDKAERWLKGEAALNYLRDRLMETFSDDDVEVKPSTSLLSDSSAGRRVLKLNPFKSYTPQNLEIFLVHEGWAHLGTSLNGASQSQHTWLSTWAPRTTFLQEGLAILTELITGCMTHQRWNKVLLRHLGTTMAERGSNITEVYEFLRHEGMEELDAFKLSLRIFRGVPLTGGMAFTKELLYLHGLVALLRHLEALNEGIKSLWVGKVSFKEHATLLAHWQEMNPNLRYFPLGLEDPLVKERLRKLKELTQVQFTRGS